MLLALMIQRQMQLNAPVTQVTRIQVVVLPWYAQVRGKSSKTDLLLNTLTCITDSCQVNNGGCDTNAFCSHDKTTNAVICTCKTGYTNTGSASAVVCKGR